MNADFSQVVPGPAQSLTDTVQALVDQLEELEREKTEREAALAETNTKLMRLQMVDIPDVMGTIESLKLKDGRELKIKPGLAASITEENRAAAHAWLREHEHGDVIKVVELIDVRGLNEKQAAAFYKLLESKGIEHEPKEGVHPQTLKALCKELLEKGAKLPACFSIHEYKKATVTTPKGKR